jgi:cysteine desulfurase
MLYCDYNASAPLRNEVFERMLHFLRDGYGNASSVHGPGSRARCAIEEARASVAALIGAEPAEIVFTSGGTESNNLALAGVARALSPRTILSTAIEHSSVRAPLAALRTEGWKVSEVAVDSAGRVAMETLVPLLDGDVGLVSIGWANNEIGTVQPMEIIAAACQARGVLLHTDAVQALGKIPVKTIGLDLLSMSAHKLGGPQGVGALYVRRGVELRPLQYGGGQERGRRAGSENVAGIVGMGEACRLAAQEMAAYGEACVAMRDSLWLRLQSEVEGVTRNGPLQGPALPNTLNVRFDGVNGEALVAALDIEGIAVSSGSACAGGAGEPSAVLRALGRSTTASRDAIRFSFGHARGLGDIEQIASVTAALVGRIRSTRCAGSA